MVLIFQAVPPATQTPPPPAQSPSAQAADATPPKGAPDGKAVEGLTVVAPSGGFRSAIDRRSYDITKDLQATTGSVADALVNVPSVDVDPQGNVSLRGDRNVTIMIDGKVSNLYRGPGAGQALQSLPANQIERVEVITNPSAEFAPDGTAGIINLITKKTRTAGLSGGMRANFGTASRSNGGGNVAYKTDKLTLSASLTLRRDPQHNKDIEQQTVSDASGAPQLQSRQEQRGTGRVDSRSATAGLDYDLDAATRLSAQLSHSEVNYADRNTIHFAGDAPSGALVEQFGRLAGIVSDRNDTTVSTSLRRQFPGDGHELVATLSYEHTLSKTGNAYTETDLLPPAPPFFQSLGGHGFVRLPQFDLTYTRPVGMAKLKLGYSIKPEEDGFDNLGFAGADQPTAVVDPTHTDVYRFDQTVQAAFATYEQPLGRWTALAGLRVEAVHIEIDDVTSGLKAQQDYTKAFPSLHLAYALDDARQFVLSYGHRLNRPTASDFNPFRVEEDPRHFRMGTPTLTPQETDSYEAGYQFKRTGTYYLATLYYRRNAHGVTDVVTDLGGGSLLTTRENLTQSKALGLELTASGKLGNALTYTLSGNTSWTEIDASAAGFPKDRSAVTFGGKAGLTWQVAAADVLQVNGSLAAEQLTPQGRRDPMLLTTLGYRHKFNERWAATVTVNDVLNTYRQRTVIDTPTLYDRLDDSAHIQAAYIGFAYTFGVGAPKAQSFDFGG